MLVILGSKSPRRKEILELLDVDLQVYNPNVLEDIKDFKTPSEYVLKTALKKGIATKNQFPFDVVICADTVVACDGQILEKPIDKDDAFRMIKMLQNNSHYVYTGVYLGKGNEYENFVCSSKVYINSMSDEEIEEYLQTPEAYDKAGAYAIQGIFAKFIDRIEGDYYNVMGLPLSMIYQKLKKYKS